MQDNNASEAGQYSLMDILSTPGKRRFQTASFTAKRSELFLPAAPNQLREKVRQTWNKECLQEQCMRPHVRSYSPVQTRCPGCLKTITSTMMPTERRNGRRGRGLSRGFIVRCCAPGTLCSRWYAHLLNANLISCRMNGTSVTRCRVLLFGTTSVSIRKLWRRTQSFVWKTL